MIKQMVDLASMDFEEMQIFLQNLGQPKFRVKQLYSWVHKGVEFEQMGNLPADLRTQLSQNAVANPVTIERALVSQSDGTTKFLFKMLDGNMVEGVLMRYSYGNTLCLSTQVGCKMGCAFCASTLEGCVRNLTAGEMIGQILCANRYLQSCDMQKRVGNLVLMGSGEPLDNYENVLKFVRIGVDERGLNQSMRGISLSTCGLVPEMYRLAEETLPITLSLSLHASNDEVRKRIMPIAHRYSLEETLDACRNYVEKTGRRVIFEYALIKNVNTDLTFADELAGKLRGLQCHVNLIPLNSVPERDLHGPTAQEAQAFLDRLTLRHISATKRREMGNDIQGACGQLRRYAIQKDNLEENDK